MALKNWAKTRVPDLQNDNKLKALASAKASDDLEDEGERSFACIYNSFCFSIHSKYFLSIYW